MIDAGPDFPRGILDPGDMAGAVAALPEQIEAAVVRLAGLSLPPGLADGIDAVAVLGMGGSAIAADLAAAMLAEELAVPMQVVRDEALPGWVGPRTLAIASSFSGGTVETMGAFRAAGGRRARRVAITTGGPLADLARAERVPVVGLPAGGQPRAALGDSLVSVLAVLRAAGLVADAGPPLAVATAEMRRLVAAWRDGGDAPRALARSLAGRIPFVFAPTDLAPVARRWKGQINENAKMAAAWDVVPELAHNTVVGFEHPPGLPERVHVVSLTGPGTPAASARRLEAVGELLAERGLGHTVVRAPAGPRLAEALWLVQFGDLVSLELAFANGVDPTPVDAIARLKRALT